MEKNRYDGTYFFDDEPKFCWAKHKVVGKGLLGVEVSVTEVVSGCLGEIESVSPTARIMRMLTM